MKQKLFTILDACIWLPKLVFVVVLLMIIGDADAMTCANWKNVAQSFAEARDHGVTEAKMVDVITNETLSGKLPKAQYENNLGVLSGVYHAPSLKDAAPETVGRVAEITCHQSHWEKQ
jgi:hypothetical protein